MAVAMRLCAREANSIDDAGVVETIGEDSRLAVGERREHADVGQITATDEERRFRALEGRNFLLQRRGLGVVARHQARRARAGAAGGSFCGGLDQKWMTRQPQVVVGREVDQARSTPVGDRLGRLLGHLQPALERALHTPLALGLEPVIPGAHRDSLPHRRDRRGGESAPARVRPIVLRSAPGCRRCSRRRLRSERRRRPRDRAPAPPRS